MAIHAVCNLLRFRETAVEARDAIEYGHGACLQTVPATMKDPRQRSRKGTLSASHRLRQVSPASIVSTCLFRAEPLRSSCSTDNGVPVARGKKIPATAGFHHEGAIGAATADPRRSMSSVIVDIQKQFGRWAKPT